MNRSLYKGPYVACSLYKKVASIRAKSKTDPLIIQKSCIKVYSRSSVILPSFVGMTFSVYNGRRFIQIHVIDEMVGCRFGEFAFTRVFGGHSKSKPRLISRGFSKAKGFSKK